MKATFNSAPQDFPAGTAAVYLLTLVGRATGARIQVRAAAETDGATGIEVDFSPYAADSFDGTIALVDGADNPLATPVSSDPAAPYIWIGVSAVPSAPSVVTFNVPTSLQLA